MVRQQQLMSCLSIPKKLQPIKKAWKAFTNKLQSKLYKLKNSEPIKKTTHLICTSIRPRRRRHLHQQQQQQLQKSTATIYVDELFAETVPVCANCKHPYAPGETSKAKEMKAADAASMLTLQRRPMNTVGIEVFEEKGRPRPIRKKKESKQKSTYDVDDAWKAAVDSSPQLRGVDERAEEFISKFRTEMKLQKEKSILDFQEMLARSA